MKKQLLHLQKIILVFLVLALAGTIGCKKDFLQKTGNNQLKSDWLLPVVKGKLSLENLSQLRNNHIAHNVPPLSLGMPSNVPVNVPPLSINHVGPFAQEISPWIFKANVDSLEIDIKLTNFFPITISAGTQVTFRNDADTLHASNIITSVVIPNDVLPNQDFTISIKVQNKAIEDTVFIYLDKFASPGGNNMVFSTDPTLLDITLKVIVLKSLEMYNNKSFVSVDTFGVSMSTSDNLSGSTNGVVSDTSATGTIHVYFDNTLPINTAFQLYFLNDAKTQVIDSLFQKPLIVGGAHTNSLGVPGNTVSTDNAVAISLKRINTIKLSKYAISRFNFNTNGYPPPKVVADRTAALKVQIVGDLSINLLF